MSLRLYPQAKPFDQLPKGKLLEDEQALFSE
jgi:hypothetical protein